MGQFLLDGIQFTADNSTLNTTGEVLSSYKIAI